MMEELRNPIIVVLVATYMGMCVLIGIWAMRRTRSTRDFFMAGRNLGVMITGVAIFSSSMSGFGFIGGPGLVYSMGIASVWMIITAAIGWGISDFLVAKRLRMFAEFFDTVSLPDAVAARYGSETTRLLTAVAILLGVMGYLATQILAMATILWSLMQTTALAPYASLPACMALATSVVVFYSVTGGIVASVYTDLFQGSVMVVAAVLIFFTALSAVDGGTAGAMTTIMVDDPEAAGPWGTLGMLGCLSWYFMFTLGAAGQPHMLTKGMMINRLQNYRYIPLVTVGGYTLAALLWISIGLAMRALVIQGVHPDLASADAAAPEFLQYFTHPLLAAVVFAGLFAAIMSTADGFLNIGAAALVHDIPRAVRGRPLQNELLWARWGTVFVALLATGFALYSHYANARLIALLGVFGWGTFGAALVPAVAIGFNWKRATPLAANVAIASSLVVNFTIEVLNVAIPYNIHGGTVSLLLSLVLFFGISLASPLPKLDPDVEALMRI